MIYDAPSECWLNEAKQINFYASRHDNWRIHSNHMKTQKKNEFSSCGRKVWNRLFHKMHCLAEGKLNIFNGISEWEREQREIIAQRKAENVEFFHQLELTQLTTQKNIFFLLLSYCVAASAFASVRTDTWRIYIFISI